MSYFLLVDDDSDSTMLLQRALRKTGRAAVRLTSPEEALERVEKEPDEIVAVVTDLMMPGSMNGAELARRVKAIAKIPVILVLGGEVPADGVNLSIFDAVELKPADPAKLLEAIERALKPRPAPDVIFAK